jgi:hypothetical protein
MTDQPEYSGGKTNYYMVDVISPVDQRSDPYTAECQDIIETLGMDFNEGNAFKALWRRAAARLGKSKRGYTDGLYDAEKVEFYGKRLVELERRSRPVVEPDPVTVGDFCCVRNSDSSHDSSCPGAGKVFGVDPPDPFGPRDADGWYTWNGDDTMRPAGQVDYLMRGDVSFESGTAGGLRWNHEGTTGDIVKWRPAVNPPSAQCSVDCSPGCRTCNVTL